MRSITLLLLAALGLSAQTNNPTPLRVYWQQGITSSTVIDNRSQQTRQLTYVSAACSGSGSWEVSLEYGSTSSGPWTIYGSGATIDQDTSVPIASGFLFTFPNYVRIDITGTVTCNLAGYQQLYVGSGGGGSVTFPIQISEGGTGATTAAGARSNLGLSLPLAVASGGTGATTAAGARTNLGITLPVPVTDGGTGATTASGARTALGLNLTGIYTGDGTTPSGLAASSQLQYLRRTKAPGTTPAYEFKDWPIYRTEDYNFSTTSATSITGAAYNEVTLTGGCPLGVAGTNFDYPVTITNVTNNGSGSIRITHGSISMPNGSRVTISGVGGVTAANGEFLINVISSTTFDLVGSVFSGTYTSGGTVYRNIYNLYITGGVGTSELVNVSGGTCTPGAASGTLRFYASFSHSGAYTISSATAGGQEAMYADANSFKRIQYPSGAITINGIFIMSGTYVLDISGQGITNTVFIRGFNTSGPLFSVRNLGGNNIFSLHDFWVNSSGQTLGTGSAAIDLRNITCCGASIYNVKIWNEYVGIKIDSTDDVHISNVQSLQSDTSPTFKPLAGLYVTQGTGYYGGSSSNIFVDSSEFVAHEGLTIGVYEITDAVNNGSGLIQIEVTSATTFATGDKVTIANVGGTTEANGDWTITKVSSTKFDLQGSTFTNAYTSGGDASYTNVQANGMLVESADGLMVSNSYFRGDYGIRVNPSVTISGLRVSTSILDKSKYSAVAIGAGSSTLQGEITFTNNWLTGNFYPGSPGVVIDMTNITSGRFTFADNEIAGHQGDCVWLISNKYTTFHDNKIVSCNLSGGVYSGIALSTTSNFIDIHDNTFLDQATLGSTTTHAFALSSDITNSTIHDNVIGQLATSNSIVYNGGTNSNFKLTDNIMLDSTPSSGITSNTIAIPANKTEYLGISASGTVSRMTGGWPGLTIKVIFTGATTIATGGTNPGDFGHGFVAAQGQVVPFTMLSDGKWYSVF